MSTKRSQVGCVKLIRKQEIILCHSVLQIVPQKPRKLNKICKTKLLNYWLQRTIKRKQMKQNFYSCTTMANIEKATETKSKRHMQKSIWKQEIKKIYSPHDKNITAHSQWAVKNLLQSKKCPNFADVLLHAWPLFVQIIFFTLINAKAWVFAVNRFSQFIGRGFTNRSKSRIYLSNNVVHCHFSLRKYRKLL